MSAKNIARQWITPITLGSFIVSAVTGILLIFHIRSSFINWSHEWLSLVFVVGALVHCLINYKPLKTSVVRFKGAVIVAAFVAVAGVAMFTQEQSGTGGYNGHRNHGGYSAVPAETGKMYVAMGNLPLETLAVATGHTQDEVVEVLASQHITVSSQTQTLAELASQNGTQSADLLKLVL